MTTLNDLADIIRSKNAGPFTMTLDILFNERANYERTKQAGVINPEQIAALYGLDPSIITVYYFDTASAIKVTFPRKYSCGSFHDSDVYGAQQQAPLLGIVVEE